jgi:hypothetical protein
MKDFFISYNRFDQPWAEWVAWVLEAAGYSVIIQAWDFRPGGNFILDMQRATAGTHKTIAVLSETYLKSAYTQPEWAAAFAQDPNALERKLIPVRVKECQPEGMLKPLVYVNLVGASKDEAKQKLLDIMRERVKPDREPQFPGDNVTPQPPTTKPPEPAVPFPQDATRTQATNRVAQLKAHNLEQQIQALEEDYTAAFDQLKSTLEPVHQTRLERQIQAIESKLMELAEQLETPVTGN